MSLSSAIRAGVSAGFKAAGDLKKSVTVTTTIGGAYDPVTETVTGGVPETLIIENCIVGSFTEFAISSSNGRILFTDVKLIIESSQIVDLDGTIIDTPWDWWFRKFGNTFYNNSVFTIDGVDYRIVNPANTGRSAQGIRIAAGDFVRVYQLRA
jgi:hypothetical protein